MQSHRALVLVATLGTFALAGRGALAQSPPPSPPPAQQPATETDATASQTPAGQPPSPSAPTSATDSGPSSGIRIVPPDPPATSPSAAAPGMPPSTTPSSERRSTVEVDASSVLGSTVRNSDGTELGRVSRLMLDPRDGRITTVVIGMGGTLGIGEKQLAVPWSSVRVGQDGQRIVVTVDKGLLEQAPRAQNRGRDEPAASPGTEQEGKRSDKK